MMKPSPPKKTLIVASLSVVVAVAVYLSIFKQPRESSAPPPIEPPITTTKVPATPPEEPRPLVSAITLPVAPTEAPAPTRPRPARPKPQPLPAATLQALTVRYNGLLEQARVAKGVLDEKKEADPVLAPVLDAKLTGLKLPLLLLTHARLLKDPVLRPVMMTRLEKSFTGGSGFFETLDKAAAKYGYKKRTAATAKTPEDLAAMYQDLEAFVQTDYEGLLEKLEVADDEAQAFEAVYQSEVIDGLFASYIIDHGYAYNRERQTLEPR